MARRIGKKRNAKIPQAKGRSKSQSELQRIESVLGEDFESLSQARKALAQQTTAVPHKKSYTVSELSHKSHRTVKTFVVDLEEHSAEVDSLKRPQEFWAAEIYGNKTYLLYSNISELAKKLASYRGLQEEHPRKALKNIKIIKVSGQDAEKYFREKEAQRKLSREKAIRLGKLDRKRDRRQARKISQLEQQIKELRKKLKKKR